MVRKPPSRSRSRTWPGSHARSGSGVSRSWRFHPVGRSVATREPVLIAAPMQPNDDRDHQVGNDAEPVGTVLALVQVGVQQEEQQEREASTRKRVLR